MSKSFFFVFHSHIPYVLGHGTWPHGMNWLYEVAAESYIPLLRMFERQAQRGRRNLSVVSITPVLAEQLSSSTFRIGFKNYLTGRIDAATEDIKYFSSVNDSRMMEIASFWKEYYSEILVYFTSIEGDIIGKFSRLQDEGAIEIITSAATHGYLPLLKYDEDVNAQVREGIRTYEKYFNRQPLGFWLPECAYRPGYKWSPPVGRGEIIDRAGIEEILQRHGIRYFFVDTHLLKGGKPVGTYVDRFEGLRLLWDRIAKEYGPENRGLSPYESHYVASSSVAFFTRDPITALQVWSGKHGYPGDPNYLEFHKKRFPSGLRYWRVTGADVDLGGKDVYNRKNIEGVLDMHADHFVSLLDGIFKDIGDGVVVAMYDTELFGHWWFEGVWWLERVFDRISESQSVSTTIPSNYLEENPPADIVSLPEGSWGEGGFHYVWLNEWTSWIWERIYEAEELVRRRIPDAGRFYRDVNTMEVFKQMLRELLLLESSDWPFLVTTWSARDYAEERAAYHYDNILKLYRVLERFESSGAISREDMTLCREILQRDKLFEDIDVRSWVMGRYKG